MMHHRGEPLVDRLRIYAELPIVAEGSLTSALDQMRQRCAGRADIYKVRQLGLRIMDLTALAAVQSALPREKHEIDTVIDKWNGELSGRIRNVSVKVKHPVRPLYVFDSDVRIKLEGKTKPSYLKSVRETVGEYFESRVRYDERGCASDPFERMKLGEVVTRLRDGTHGDMRVYRGALSAGFSTPGELEDFKRHINIEAGLCAEDGKRGGAVKFPEAITFGGLRIVHEIQEPNERFVSDFDPERLLEELRTTRPRTSPEATEEWGSYPEF